MAYDHRDELIAETDPLGHLTCLERRKDGRVVAQTTPRGTESDPGRCTDGDPQTGYTHYTTRYAYDPAGALASRSVPFAPGQYGRTDAQLAAWKITYQRDPAGNPTTITDARGNSFTNTFYDTGELRTTDRPSFFAFQDGAVAEREGRSANAGRSDETPEKLSTLGQTDFGRVDPEPLPDLLPQAGSTRFVYDEEMRLTTVRDVLGHERTFTYDPAGRISQRTWPYKPSDPITHTVAYDKHGNPTQTTDGKGEQTSYLYDGYDRRSQRTAPGAHPTDAAAAAIAEVTRLRYDHNGNLRFRETPRGVETATAGDYTHETGYDSLDRRVFELAADGARTTFTYDVASNLLTKTSPRGQGTTGAELTSFQTRMSYDDADRLIESRENVSDDGQYGDLVATRVYDADDNLTQLTSPGARRSPAADVAPQVTETIYDGRGLPWKTSRGTGGDRLRSVVEYDAGGNLRRSVRPRGVDQATGVPLTADSGADTHANLVAASKNATVSRYDEHDLLVSQRVPWNDDDTRIFRREFQRTDSDPNTDDRLRRIRSILSPHEVTDEGQLADEKVARTSYRYFAGGWIEAVSDEKLVDPASNQRLESRLIEFDYDKRGAQTEWRSKHAGESAAGRHIVRTFWPSGAMRSRTAKKTTDPDEPATRRRYEYGYNANRSLVQLRDENKNRTTVIARDAVERQAAVNETWAAGKDTVQTFDLAGNVLTRKTDGKLQTDGTFTGTDAKTTTFAYDSLDRETQMTVDPPTGADRETTTRWWPSGDKRSRVKPNGTTERWFYNTRGQQARFERQPDGATSPDPDDSLDYGYDANGNRDADQRGSHEFNARDQLTKWTDEDGKITDYELGGDGATTKKTVRTSPSDPTPDVTDYTYRGERLLWSGNDQVRAYYRYDDFGNVTRIKQTALSGGVFPPVDDNAPQSSDCAEIPGDVSSDDTYYCYDEFERLRLSRGAGIDDPELLDYDGLDRRDTRTTGSGENETTRDLSYVGMSELLSRETDSSGDRKSYDYDSTGDRQGQHVTTSAGANRYRAYTKDANGSVLGLETDDGQIAADGRYQYDPYGNLDAEPIDAEAKDNPFRFEGFYYDTGVKSYDMHARHYRPDTGRFLTQDRYASATQDLLLQADPLSQNRYAFAGANPVNNIEFDGHYKGNEGAAQRAMKKSSKTPRGKRAATDAEGFIPGAKGSAGVIPTTFTPTASGDAPLTDVSSTGTGNPTLAPVLAPPPRRPDSCAAPATGPAAGSGLTCPKDPRVQYQCLGTTETALGESACAAYKEMDPTLINASVQEVTGGGLVAYGARAVAARACKQWCDDLAAGAQRVANRLTPNAAKPATPTGLRRVGDVLEAPTDALANPQLLAGRTPGQVDSILSRAPGWRKETLGQGSRKGQGYVLREYTEAGNPTGNSIRWHPGGGHHGPNPYWRTTSSRWGKSGIIR